MKNEYACLTNRKHHQPSAKKPKTIRSRRRQHKSLGFLTELDTYNIFGERIDIQLSPNRKPFTGVFGINEPLSQSTNNETEADASEESSSGESQEEEAVQQQSNSNSNDLQRVDPGSSGILPQLVGNNATPSQARSVEMPRSGSVSTHRRSVSAPLPYTATPDAQAHPSWRSQLPNQVPIQYISSPFGEYTMPNAEAYQHMDATQTVYPVEPDTSAQAFQGYVDPQLAETYPGGLPVSWGKMDVDNTMSELSQISFGRPAFPAMYEEFEQLGNPYVLAQNYPIPHHSTERYYSEMADECFTTGFQVPQSIAFGGQPDPGYSLLPNDRILDSVSQVPRGANTWSGGADGILGSVAPFSAFPQFQPVDEGVQPTTSSNQGFNYFSGTPMAVCCAFGA